MIVLKRRQETVKVDLNKPTYSKVLELVSQCDESITEVLDKLIAYALNNVAFADDSTDDASGIQEPPNEPEDMAPKTQESTSLCMPYGTQAKQYIAEKAAKYWGAKTPECRQICKRLYQNIRNTYNNDFSLAEEDYTTPVGRERVERLVDSYLTKYLAKENRCFKAAYEQMTEVGDVSDTVKRAAGDCLKNILSSYGYAYDELCENYALNEEIRDSVNKYIKDYMYGLTERYPYEKGTASIKYKKPAALIKTETKQSKTELSEYDILLYRLESMLAERTPKRHVKDYYTSAYKKMTDVYGIVWAQEYKDYYASHTSKARRIDLVKCNPGLWSIFFPILQDLSGAYIK